MAEHGPKAVFVEHLAEECPADIPERGDVVVDNLREAEATGVFIPPHHKGVSLVEGISSEDAVNAHDSILPDHTIEIADLEETEQVRKWLDDKSHLDEKAEQDVFLAVMHEKFPDKGLDAPLSDSSIPTKSLTQLPDYIAGKNKAIRESQ